jgi:glutathione S-transferase
MYHLIIGNKNYSSWSLRPWVLMQELGIPHSEQLLQFGHAPSWQQLRKVSPTGRVPCLVDGAQIVWDSLAICEYLAERHAGVWPADAVARAFARCAAAEMHSSFTELRNRCSMSCGVRVRLKEFSVALRADVARIGQLWNDALQRFGGPFLGGAAFSAVDAFFAPVAFRVQTFDLPLDAAATSYVRRILDLPSMRRWYADALAEEFRDEPHEREMLAEGTVLKDFRQS